MPRSSPAGHGPVGTSRVERLVTSSSVACAHAAEAQPIASDTATPAATSFFIVASEQLPGAGESTPRARVLLRRSPPWYRRPPEEGQCNEEHAHPLRGGHEGPALDRL